MAQAAHLSKFHFAHAFAAAYGETPRAYLTRRRIERRSAANPRLVCPDVDAAEPGTQQAGRSQGRRSGKALAMITKLSHLNVFVLDQERAKKLYTEKLDFEERTT